MYRFEIEHTASGMHRAVIIADDGVVAHRTPFHDSERYSRLIGGKLVRSFEYYLSGTGKRWEIEREELRLVESKKRRIAKLEIEIPRLQEELEKLRGEVPPPIPVGKYGPRH